MSKYIPTDWKDEIVDGAGNIVQQGTPLSAANLKKIEAGVEGAVAAVEDKVDGAVFDKFKTEATTALAETASIINVLRNPGEYLAERLKSGSPMTIKLIGDSISAGQGATGYKVVNTNPVIFTDTLGVTQYEASYNSLSWANKFRNYMLAKNPLNTFKNWGIGGKSTSYWVTNKANIKNEDIVFVMIGTNDRTGSLSAYRTNLTALLTHVKANSNYTVVMAANPLSSLVETYSFTNEEAARTITEVCMELNLPLINHFEGFMEFSKFGNVYTDFLSDGIHPNDAGHELIWNTIQDNLNFYDVKYRENLLNYYKVLPSNFGGFTTAFDGRQHIMPTNIHKNAILDSWTAGVPTESAKSSGLVVEQIPSFFKGKYAVKLTSTSANSYFTFPLSINSTKENAKMLLSYQSKGAARLAVYQNGVTDALLDTWLEEGQFNKVYELPFNSEGITGYFVRIWPDVTLKGGFTSVDTLAVVKNQHYNYGFFTDEDRVNVRWFDVNGDGTVETAKVTAMIQQLGVGPTNPGYTLYYPKGNYINGNLANMNKKVVVEGDGYETVFDRAFTNAIHKNIRVVNTMRNDIIQTSPNGTHYVIGVDDTGARTSTVWTYT